MAAMGASNSQRFGSMLSGQKVETLLALHTLLLVDIIGAESGGVSRLGGCTAGVVKFEGVDALALSVKEKSEVHFIINNNTIISAS
jgi:hypothetical protein